VRHVLSKCRHSGPRSGVIRDSEAQSHPCANHHLHMLASSPGVVQAIDFNKTLNRQRHTASPSPPAAVSKGWVVGHAVCGAGGLDLVLASLVKVYLLSFQFSTCCGKGSRENKQAQRITLTPHMQSGYLAAQQTPPFPPSGSATHFGSASSKRTTICPKRPVSDLNLPLLVNLTLGC